MEAERIFEECIKPSSPTLHPKTYKISLLDQFVPCIYFPVILFYRNENPNLPDINSIISERSKLLKQSLSETLTHFYPLAGRIKDKLSIDCNDEGVFYVEARVNTSLSEYQNQHEFLASTTTLLPEKLNQYQELAPGSYVAMIQETNFACGGITIGILASHMIMDGTALSSFLRYWASVTSKSREGLVYPNFDSSFLFPQYESFPKEATVYGMMSSVGVQVGKISIKRFKFDASTIAALKAKAISLSVENPTSVEVLSALFSKHIMAISKARSGVEKQLAIMHSVNLRRKASPPLSKSSMGNFLWQVATLCKPDEATFSSILRQIRDAIAKVDGDFVKKLQGDEGFLNLYEMVKETSGVLHDVEHINFVSWCNFGLYETDFGWGKPAWVTNFVDCLGNSETVLAGSLVYFMDTKEEKGIEAWAFMNEKDMLLLEKDSDFLQYACVDP
ncbi:stemmadenine O-acetyltransferase-like [Mercurialis annua]|uniref:stemmadenine O-acetyltransferase-like n=1 Tax=Mercurialis annua TaxID=3986 RepID=UPI00215FF091|nr:stemmadenine O-acetyltransferase-like [Mercurialis annua]